MPPRRVTIRVPWHDVRWTETVCARPLDNSGCLILRRIGEGRRDQVEARCASRQLDELTATSCPPCGRARLVHGALHAYTDDDAPIHGVLPATHSHLAPTRFLQPAYFAACVPYQWMLREKVAGSAKDGEIGIAERLKIGWVPDREPDIRNRRQLYAMLLSRLHVFFCQ